jgi:hypothetical protein
VRSLLGAFALQNYDDRRFLGGQYMEAGTVLYRSHGDF